MSLYIGIDSGTQSTKAVILDLDTRKVLAQARAPHTLIAGPPAGHMEQHPRDWAAALDNVIAAACEKIGRAVPCRFCIARRPRHRAPIRRAPVKTPAPAMHGLWMDGFHVKSKQREHPAPL